MDIYQTKCCTKCNIIKPISDFYKDKSTKDGHVFQCKQCRKEHVLMNKDKFQEYDRKYKQQYREQNREEYNKQHREYQNEYRLTKSDTIRDRERKYNNEYIKQRIANDTIFALKVRMKSLIRKSITSKGYSKTSKTYEILGCSFEELYIHIESQFKDGMNWDNRSEWHIDHIIPLKSAKTEDELIKLNHYTNLQPLWAIDNLRKGSNIT